jgi:RAD51-like protein 2
MIGNLVYTQGTPSRTDLSTPASALLSSPSECRFSTLSRPIDTLVGHFAQVAPRNRKGKERAGATGTIVPGMSLEISGPPGSGKTAMSIALALSARLGRWRGAEEEGYEEEDEHIGEVLLIGKSSFRRH